MNLKDKINLYGRTAVVTGSGQGIGREIAVSLAEAGCNLAIVDIDMENAEKTSGEIKKNGWKAIAIKCDITKIDEVKKMREETMGEFKKIDILVNNAGVGSPQEPMEEMSLDTWNRVIDVNLTGVFICSKIVGQQMIKQGEGKIVNIASMTGLVANKSVYVGPYAAAKAGVIMLTKALARDWAPYNINVNCVSPGYIITPLNQPLLDDKEWYREAMELIPVKKLGEPSDIAGIVVFLCSDAAGFMVGSNVIIDGGYTIM
ncbi:MAG: SDR family oxidoreductase [Actinobacteria bacterium]|nr:SDR family oxidoreductase [Actinomycetota bacterium]